MADMTMDLTWNPKVGASGGWETYHKGWEITVQSCYKRFEREPTRWYVVFRVLDPTKDYFSGKIKRFASRNIYAETKEEALDKGVLYLETELIPHEQEIKEIDKRSLGWYCSDCGRFSDTPQMVFGEQWVNHWDENERWFVKVHYDGCRGWD